ncbi:MAG TPA: hypothetical protein VFP72_07050, partial [Kineosporiaceae bacterium]|nr:hypothetical protein [Kineosporiaceae bacterium]
AGTATAARDGAVAQAGSDAAAQESEDEGTPPAVRAWDGLSAWAPPPSLAERLVEQGLRGREFDLAPDAARVIAALRGVTEIGLLEHPWLAVTDDVSYHFVDKLSAPVAGEVARQVLEWRARQDLAARLVEWGDQAHTDNPLAYTRLEKIRDGLRDSLDAVLTWADHLRAGVVQGEGLSPRELAEPAEFVRLLREATVTALGGPGTAGQRRGLHRIVADAEFDGAWAELARRVTQRRLGARDADYTRQSLNRLVAALLRGRAPALLRDEAAARAQAERLAAEERAAEQAAAEQQAAEEQAAEDQVAEVRAAELRAAGLPVPEQPAPAQREAPEAPPVAVRPVVPADRVDSVWGPEGMSEAAQQGLVEWYGQNRTAPGNTARVVLDVASGRVPPVELMRRFTARGREFLGSGPGLEAWAAQAQSAVEALQAGGRAALPLPPHAPVRFLDAGAELVLHDLARWAVVNGTNARRRGHSPTEIAPLVKVIADTYASGLANLMSGTLAPATQASATRSFDAFAGPGSEQVWRLVTEILQSAQAGDLSSALAIASTTRLLGLNRTAMDASLGGHDAQAFGRSAGDRTDAGSREAAGTSQSRPGKRRAAEAGLDGPATADGESARPGKRQAVADATGDPTWTGREAVADGPQDGTAGPDRHQLLEQLDRSWGRPGERQATTGDRTLPAYPVFRRTEAMTALASLLTGDRPGQQVREELLSALVNRASEVALGTRFAPAEARPAATDAAGVRLLDVGVQLTLHDLETEAAAAAAGRGGLVEGELAARSREAAGRPGAPVIDPAGRGLAAPADLVPLLQQVYRDRLAELVAGEAADA